MKNSHGSVIDEHVALNTLNKMLESSDALKLEGKKEIKIYLKNIKTN
jgi:hypothetical protein